MGEILELFVLALSLVWFAGATPDLFKRGRKTYTEKQNLAIALCPGIARKKAGGSNVWALKEVGPK